MTYISIHCAQNGI